MEYHMYSYLWTLGLLASTCFLLLLGGRIIWFRKRDVNSKKLKLPPGSAGWPFIGETVDFIRSLNSPQPQRFTKEHESKYGPIFRCNLFGRSRNVLTVDPEFNKYVYQNEGRLFKAKYPVSTRQLVGKYGMLEVHGELQRKLHAVAASLVKYEVLSRDFLDDIQDLFVTGMKKWEEEKEIRLQPKCNQLVLNLMARKLLSLPHAEEMQEFYTALQHFVDAFLSVPINIPGTSYSKGIKARNYIVKKVHEFIRERRQHPEKVYNDLLDKLLKEGTFSDEIIADLILFMVFAGHETSSRIMAFAIKYLTENPLALEELRAEHDALLLAKGNGKLTMEDYQSMKFTHCVTSETLRRANVAGAIFREAKQDIKVKDFVIPKGWSIIVFTTGTHLDEKNHPNPLEFDPWRWQREGRDMSDKSPAFMPFGGGARLCPGYHLARFEIALFLHNFVTKFRWEVIESERTVYFPLPSNAKGFPIRLYPRSME